MQHTDLLKVKQRIKQSKLYPFLSPLVFRYRRIRAIPLARYRRRQKRGQFQCDLRNTDVFLVGHPKSGNTWMAYMLAIILSKDFQQHVTLSNIGTYVPLLVYWDRQISEYTHLQEPRIFRNEWPVYPDLYPKVIYMVRYPGTVPARGAI